MTRHTRRSKSRSRKGRGSRSSQEPRQDSKKSKMTHGTEPIPGKCCDSTTIGLHNWYKDMFEKLGWMVLAHSRGMTDKIQTYLNSLERLHMALQQKIAKMRDPDNKEDLVIMLKNVEELLSHSQKDFNPLKI
jgi:hypothetical protein